MVKIQVILSAKTSIYHFRFDRYPAWFLPLPVVELSGVGYGTGDSIALQDGSSYRLVKLFQAAAKKYNDPTTTRGRSPHYGREVVAGFGDRRALTLAISWDGSDHLAHTPIDIPQFIDPQKLTRVGRSTLLTLMILVREPNY